MNFRRRALVLGNGARADGYTQARILHGLDAVRPEHGVCMRRRRPAALRCRRMRRARRRNFASPNVQGTCERTATGTSRLCQCAVWSARAAVWCTV